MTVPILVVITDLVKVGAQQVAALISVCNPNYIIEAWHEALLTMAFVLAAIFFNTTAIGKLPVLEGLAVLLHFFGFFAFIVIVWVMVRLCVRPFHLYVR